jgi:hypothetical protein
MKRLILTGLVAVALGAGPAWVVAQDAGARRGFDPEQMRVRMMDRMKTELSASDEEWTVIQPLLQDVMTKQRATAAGRFGGMAAMGAPRGRPQAEGQERGRPERPGAGGGAVMGSGEVEALSKALESPNTSAAELKAKLAEVRSARQKADSELKTAREELRKVLTLRQEASLVVMGLLD